MPTAALTDEQLLARDTRDVSIGVSAGAGCGKTHVLTARFLSHLDPTPQGGADPTQLRQLIAITFTDAAAREMRTRIRNACYERLDDPTRSDGDRAEWRRLLREIDTARVSTIHAFCTALLRTHAAEAGLDPTFGVLEQGEADVLLQEVIDDVLRQRLATHDADTLDLAAAFGRLSQLKERIVLLVDQRRRPAFERWLADRLDQPAKAIEMVATWHARHERDSTRFWVQAAVEKAPLAEMQRLLAIAAPTAANKTFPAAIATLTDLLTRLQQHADDITEADLNAILENARVQSICKKTDWPTPDDFEAYKTACTKLRDAITKNQPLPWDDAAALEAAMLGQKLLCLAGDVAASYRQRKQLLARLDFDDQLALAHRLLNDPKQAAVREALSDDLRLLLVDEFQDTDPLQVELIKKICGAGFDEGRLFFVGDFKQSIYRFRGAVPPEFLKLRSEVPDAGRLQLTRNFRSQPGVLHFVNALFHDSFDDYEALQPVRDPATDAPAVEFLWKVPEYDQTQGKGSVEAARRQEAAALARRLRHLIDDSCAETPVVDKDTRQPRRLRPGDVAILFRALSDVRLYEEALREQGLDYYLVGGHAFYAQQEIFDVLNLLRAVSSFADEISLAGVLRSPFFALADESLFWLVEHGGSLNGGLFAEQLPTELAGEEQAKVLAAARAIGRLRAIKNVVPIAALLNEALDLTGYDAVLVAEFMGERKLANLLKLIEHARTADQNGNDLNDFITQLAEFIAQPPKEPLASTSAESADVIRLMTIHRAKGLEFPFVVVPDLDRPPRPEGPDAALDDELGPLVRVPKDETRDETATGMSLFVAMERTAELEERKRLLYVACTRAADYLLLSSSIESLDEPKSDWMKLIADHFDLATGEFKGKLPDKYERPRVHIAPPPETEPKPTGRSRGPDLLRMLDEAQQLAADGQGLVPTTIDPIPVDRTARRQFSFSRLTGKLSRTGATAGSPSSAAGATAGLPSSANDAAPLLDARALGSLTHDVLSRIDFNGTVANSEITDWCEHLAPQYVVDNAEEAARLATQMIERFKASPRGRQLASAAALHREIEFLLAWPPQGVAGVERQRAPSGQRAGGLAVPRPQPPIDGRYIRGFIDCLYQDSAGDWRLVDYKTTDVSPADAKHITQQYEMQLYVYAMAAERALGASPTELVLQLLRPGIEHVIPWNDTTRRRAIELVNEAIDTVVRKESLNPEP